MESHREAEDTLAAPPVTESLGLFPDGTLHLLVGQITDYAIFLLTPEGEVATWNPGAERIKGYQRHEILGKHFRIFYPPREQAARKPEYELRIAAATGRFEDEGWRVRNDGSKFWANVIITAVRGPKGELLGFGKVTRDLTERKKSEEQLRELSTRLLRAQDDERRRLGRELHDSVGQYLVAAKMSLDGLAEPNRSDPARWRKQLEDCIATIERTIQEVRTLSYLLYPPMLEETGLCSAIRWHLEGFSERSGIQTTHELTQPMERLPREIELALFRVFQESLTNVHRHSRSKTAHIRFTVEGSEAVLEVSDQGCGIPRSGSAGKLGVGIRGMQERIHHLTGKLEIKSNGAGTTVRASIPIGATAASSVLTEFS